MGAPGTTTPAALRADLLALAERLGALGQPAALLVFVEDPALLAAADRREDFITLSEVCEVGTLQRGEVEIEVRHFRPATAAERNLRGRRDSVALPADWQRIDRAAAPAPAEVR